MSDEVTLYQLGPSPNSIKARRAPAFKSVPHRRVDCDPADRALPVKLSGQPLLPVLVHGQRVVCDSCAIPRYLDANWPEAPRLYSADRATQQAIEDRELFDRTGLGAAIATCFGQLLGETEQPAAFRQANVQLAQPALRLEERLEQGEWLVGDQATATDLTCASAASYGVLLARRRRSRGSSPGTCSSRPRTRAPPLGRARHQWDRQTWRAGRSGGRRARATAGRPAPVGGPRPASNVRVTPSSGAGAAGHTDPPTWVDRARAARRP